MDSVDEILECDYLEVGEIDAQLFFHAHYEHWIIEGAPSPSQFGESVVGLRAGREALNSAQSRSAATAASFCCGAGK